MIIARFENGDWTVLGDKQCVDFLEVDDGTPEDIDSTLLDGRYRVIAAGQRVTEYGINRIQLIDSEGDKVRDGWPEPLVGTINLVKTIKNMTERNALKFLFDQGVDIEEAYDLVDRERTIVRDIPPPTRNIAGGEEGE